MSGVRPLAVILVSVSSRGVFTCPLLCLAMCAVLIPCALTGKTICYVQQTELSYPSILTGSKGPRIYKHGLN